MWSPFRIAPVLILVPLLSSPVRAQDAFLQSDPDSALAVKLEALSGEPLTLEEAFALAGDHATTIREAAGHLLAAEGAVRREKGGFDPELFAGVERSGDDSPTASPFSGAAVLETEQTRVGGGARIRLPIGTELEASLNTTRLETNSTFASLNPQFDTYGLLTLRQPLLSGFGPSARGDLSSAQRAREAAQARYNDAVLAVAAEVETAYWNIYAAERDLGVQQVIRDRAEALLNEAQLRNRAGLVGPNQVANARVFLAQQELAVLDGEERLDRLSDGFASLLGVRPSGDQVRFRPVNAPPRTFPILPVEDLVTEALRSNHELIADNATLEQYRALARAASWDALPELDLIGSIGGNGLSGTGQEVVFGSDTLRTDINGGFGDTWTQVRNRDFPTWSIGLELTVPIGFREGRGERDRLRGEAAAAEQRYIAAARSLEESVRAAHRELVHGTRRLEAAENGVDASLEQVRIGLVEYRNGRTTAFELVRLGADLADAQRSYSEALVRTAKAAAELRHLTSGAYPEGLSQ